MLLAAGNDLGVLAPFLGSAEIELTVVNGVPELIEAARRQPPDVVLLDPELGQAWPVDLAETVVQALGEQVPVIVTCRSREDARHIEHRLGPHAATVLPILDGGDAHELLSGLRGLIAAQRRRAAPP